MATVDIDTAPPKGKDPWVYARKLFVRLLLGGACAMALMYYTDGKAGLLTPIDEVMLPAVAVVTVLAALMIALSERHMKVALGLNGVALALYYDALLFQAAQSTDPISAYSLASTAQFMPGLYIALFVFLDRRAEQVCWLLYASIAALCGWGLFTAPDDQTGAMKQQIYWSMLAAQPCCIIVLTFMSHLRRMVEEARQETLQSKERFLAVVSHEVRTPLQTIVSSLEVIESAKSGPLLERALRRVMGAASVLETQIRDLTAFTKLELSPELHKAPVDLPALATTIELTYQEQARQRGLGLTLDIPATPLTVEADAARLRQILDNLVGNALKYTSSGGLTIGLCQDHDNWIHWWVRDTGRGIPPERVHDVFEPFVRIKADAQERIEGSGLGLAVVRQLVGLMGGRVTVDSTVGQGTTVHVRLPLRVLNAVEFAVLDDVPSSVLIIDDDADILQSIADLLRQWGVKDIVTAPDGEQGLVILRSRPVALALIDLQLPGMNGYQVALATRNSHDMPNKHTQLIAMSAMALDRQHPCAEAFNGYLAKPVTRQRLLQVMADARRAEDKAAQAA